MGFCLISDSRFRGTQLSSGILLPPRGTGRFVAPNKDVTAGDKIVATDLNSGFGEHVDVCVPSL
jgi:hypothetical protein